MSSICGSRIHICCVALGTRGDVQPVACIALHLQRTYKQVSVSFITHGAHSSWLEVGVFTQLTGKRYVTSPPAVGCWEGGPAIQAVPGLYDNDDHCTTRVSYSTAQTSIVQPDPRVVEAICDCIEANVIGGVDAGSGCHHSAAPHQPSSSSDPGLTLQRRVESLRCRLSAWKLRNEKQKLSRAEGKSQLAPERQDEKQEVEERQEVHVQPPPPPQPPSRYLILFNLFALEAYHAAEALDVRCAVAAPYMMPYRCPAAFVGMFRRELPDLYDSLFRVLQLQQQADAVTETTEAVMTAAAAAAAAAGALNSLEQNRVSFAEVTHWMWPLFTERWGEWRSTALGIPALPLHRYRVKTRGSESEWRGGCGSTGSGDAVHNRFHDEDAKCDDVDIPGGVEEALPFEALPPAPPLLYGFSALLVPRPAFWPRSVHLCGFWQPPLEWFVQQQHQQLPADLLALLAPPSPQASVAPSERFPQTSPPPLTPPSLSSSTAAATATAAASGSRRWCLVDFGSSGRLGLIPEPLYTLEILDQALRRVDMTAILLTGGWEPLHVAVNELMRRRRRDRCGRLSPRCCGNEDRKMPPHLQQQQQQRQQGQEQGERKRLRRNPESNGKYEQEHDESSDPYLRLHLYGGDVPHQLVMPYCRLVLHHGGSGTTAAALQCGIPQVTCPLHFDQHFWAERLADLGLSPPPLSRRLLFGGNHHRTSATAAAAAAATAAASSTAGGPYCNPDQMPDTADYDHHNNKSKNSQNSNDNYNVKVNTTGEEEDGCDDGHRDRGPLSKPEVELEEEEVACRLITAAFKTALEPSRLEAARRIAQELAAEGGGLQAAAQTLLELMHDQ